MKKTFLVVLCLSLIGCDHPTTSEERVQQIRTSVVKAGGATTVDAEARILIGRMVKTKIQQGMPVASEDPMLNGLSGLTNIGDVFEYYGNRIQVRIHNSHSDTYHVDLLNPDLPRPTNFVEISGNVGVVGPRNPLHPLK
jgi:hypothetical protein